MNAQRPRGPRQPELNGYSERALSERVKELEVHREYAATREDVSKLTAEVEKRFTALRTVVDIRLPTAPRRNPFSTVSRACQTAR